MHHLYNSVGCMPLLGYFLRLIGPPVQTIATISTSGHSVFTHVFEFLRTRQQCRCVRRRSKSMIHQVPDCALTFYSPGPHLGLLPHRHHYLLRRTGRDRAPRIVRAVPGTDRVRHAHHGYRTELPTATIDIPRTRAPALPWAHCAAILLQLHPPPNLEIRPIFLRRLHLCC